LSRRRCSIAAVLSVGDEISDWSQDAVSEDGPTSGGEIGPLDGLGSGAFGHNSGYDAVALAEFYDFSGF
jgi:hypothetical protein